jgi:hypothetical protein
VVLEGDDLRRALEELRALIADRDATALEKCEDLEARVPPEAWRALKAVLAPLSGFDFETALQAMERIP